MAVRTMIQGQLCMARNSLTKPLQRGFAKIAADGLPVKTEFKMPVTGIPYMGPSDNHLRDNKFMPQTGIAHMGGIRNFNKEYEHTALKPSEAVTIAHAKTQGFVFHRPVREYYLPGHWKQGKTHLVISLEFDELHVWVEPPVGQPFPPCPLTLSEEEQKERWPFFVPAMQKMTVYEDDWVITDVHTMWVKTPIWVIPAFERFLGTKLHEEGTPEYDALVTDNDRAELTEDPAGWVGPEFLRAANAKSTEADDDMPSEPADEDPDQMDLNKSNVHKMLVEELSQKLEDEKPEGGEGA